MRLVLFFVTVLAAAAQLARIAADPRVELLSIVFHLAGNEEYNQCRVPTYCEDVERYFTSFKDDEAVRIARELNQKSDINYDAVMSMAIHVKDIETLAERAFEANARWKAGDAARFLPALRAFVERSKFQTFVEAHAALYETAGSRLRALLESQADFAWFDKFLGAKPGARFIVVPGLFLGGDNFGPAIRAEDGREEMHAILGVAKVDAEKQPVFDKATTCPTWCTSLRTRT